MYLSKKNILLIFIFIAFVSVNGQNNLPNRNVNQKEEKFIEDLLSKMTLAEKIGQLSQYVGRELLTGPESQTLTDSLIESGLIGSILNIAGTKQLREIQRKNIEKSRLKIPILFGFDVIHGYKTITPVPLAESCSWDLELIEKSAKMASIEASAAGIHWSFAPMVDVARDPRWGRVVEGAGEDTYLGSKIAEARVKGFQWNLWQPNSVLACAKHFAAYGAPQAGRDYAPVDISMSTLAEVYLPPFKACVDANVQTFMTAFNSLNGVPATASSFLFREILQDKWKFGGFTVSDWNAVKELIAHGVAEDDKSAAIIAFNAGVDMNMTDGLYNKYLEQAVKEKQIDTKMIDESVKRILQIKYRLGLFENPFRFFDEKREKKEIKKPEFIETARDIAKKSIVLLKNENKTLPISKKVKKIALIGPLANNKSELLGSWKARGEEEDVVSLYEGIKNKLGNKAEINYAQGCDFLSTNEDGFAQAIKLASENDIVIVAVGEKALMSGESRSRASLSLPGVQEKLVQELIATGKPVVVVLMNGRPLAIPKIDEKASVILETWFLGIQSGNAIADVLFGDYNPSAKLTMSFPRSEGQIPNYYNYKRSGRPGDMEKTSTTRHIDLPNANLYPFGYGLSYTEFAYSPMICPDYFDANGKLKVEVSVTNTGTYDGEEIVQLYVSDNVASMVRPVKELKGFKKVFIPKGETVKITFDVDSKELGFWDNQMNYIVEKGSFTIMIGKNSEDVQQKIVKLM
ncbi:beta-glucosidase BglX [Capnocytophaga catalasegens]|uniref:beta-glucosidase n=1 Tax=Capnocytophaga catalasegens TaxID=1004260 RepID=A0AAV5AW89_9FLAO|nr:beta-glucosidase BglX [Capnocytophaga catalasegens]GIZ14401.1 glycosyl hydrolase [Capnocytophaga catalasegens]GJM51521.1 glycosyl hydrolase [Capnocytophaga catalasegens]GJM53425.1 glycosyl hydrolase [Capnocytophaga catalasegens]